MPEHAITPGFGRGDCERSQNDSARQSSTIDRPKRFLNAALKYSSAYGWPVHPLYEIVDGECSCKLGAECGKNAGKHPASSGKITSQARSFALPTTRSYADGGLSGPLQMSGFQRATVLQFLTLTPDTGAMRSLPVWKLRTVHYLRPRKR
jgi:hypothetical protein